MSIDPLHQLVHSRRADLMADARRHDLGRAAAPRTAGPGRLRTATAGLLFAVASRLQASAAPAPATPPPSPC
jgi:hypothetical protein